jgi:hypothetical protein
MKEIILAADSSLLNLPEDCRVLVKEENILASKNESMMKKELDQVRLTISQIIENQITQSLVQSISSTSSILSDCQSSNVSEKILVDVTLAETLQAAVAAMRSSEIVEEDSEREIVNISDCVKFNESKNDMKFERFTN